MKCEICGSKDIFITYEGKIRDGRVGHYTDNDMKMYQCKNCRTIWHDMINRDYKQYYESKEYRKDLEGTSDIQKFYDMHDKESLEKFRYTGTEIFRNKIVADVGSGGGAFLDYINTVAKKVIAIEPSKYYREELVKKGYTVFAYAEDALKEYREKIDIIISFDVIEHVENPTKFLGEIYALLSQEGGKAFIGTPSDAPVMRDMLGEKYEMFLFSTQHPWVLSKDSFKEMISQHKISRFRIRYFQRYGLGNFIWWLLNKEPGQHRKYDFVTNTLNQVWISELEKQEKADYIVCEIQK